ncbi:MAG: hypothetical protein NVSMB64_13520 [Candidatus Velthaea sp.]
MRRRDEHFCEALLEAVAERGGVLSDEAIIEASTLAYLAPGGGHAGPKLALRRGKAKLQVPEVQEKLGDFYAEVSKFTPADAVRMHVKHIKGQFTDGDGKAIPPSYAALRDYQKLVFPSSPKVTVNKNLNLHGRVGSIMSGDRGDSPEIHTRQLGGLIEVETERVEIEMTDDGAVDE